MHSISLKQVCFLLTYVFMPLLFCHDPATLLSVAYGAQIPTHNNATDRLALLAFKSLISDDPFGVLASWNDSVHHCHWPGVSCARRHPGRVTVLALDSLGLAGTVSPSLGNLTFLKNLSFSDNGLHDSIPEELGRLFRLQLLNLSVNSLHGTIPSSLTNCRHIQHISLWMNSFRGGLPSNISNWQELQTMDLSNNLLEGPVPEELSLLSKLTAINLSNNSLTGGIPGSLGRMSSLTILNLKSNWLAGEIPASLGNLSSLVDLNLAKNKLSGSIPPSLGNLSSLTRAGLFCNLLTGEIPASLGDLSSLQYLSVKDNQLSAMIPATLYNLTTLSHFEVGQNNLIGTLPPDLGNTLPNLQKLLFFENQLHGTIPLSLSNASQLTFLEFYGNHLTGTIPENLGNLKNLARLDLSRNQLQARDAHEWRFMAALSNCTNLQRLQLDQNLLGLVLPNSIANLSQSLSQLILSQNQISGSIPIEISNLANLTLLDFSQNLLNGTIPDTIGRLQQLRILDISGNEINGTIPSSLGNLASLIKLFLDNNHLSGSIPKEIGKLQRLGELYLSENRLTGVIPMELFTISSLSILLNLSHNSLTGSLPEEIGSLESLGAIDVSKNRLVGKLPISIGHCQLLTYLNLRGNSFQGTIPQQLGQLKGIGYMDLSLNNLSGQIPDSLERLAVLEYLNLSYNNFNGKVPLNGIFSNPSAVSITGNYELCGGNPLFNLQQCLLIRKRHHSATLKVILSVVSVGLCFCVCCFLAAEWCIYRKSRKKPPSKPLLKHEHMRLSYDELLKATDGFSSENFLGSGSFGRVYKGIFQGGTVVAVKVLNLDRQGASKSFWTECEALRDIRHRNLVGVVTSCSSIDHQGNEFKALVYEFMPNGSLERWLHPEGEQQPQMRRLSLTERLDICIDVALALDYLHDHIPATIVHCDLKPSNILLDNDMVAHVGDFGLAKILTGADGSSSQAASFSCRLKGTVGYVPPEYGTANKVSTYGDVYSYGVLLLEMFTGKRPTDEIFKEGLSLRKFVEMALPERVVEAVDPHILYHEEEAHGIDRINKCLNSVFRIGLLCTMELPQERMEIETIIKELIEAMDVFRRPE